MEDRSQRLRSEFAGLVAARTKGRNPAVEQVFASVKREAFAGPGPWSVAMLSATDFVRTPDDDPAHLYQDVLIALDPARNLNIGLPSGHAIWLDAIDVKAGDHVVQVGAGTGYYTAILAHLVGGAGRVDAFEIEPDLAARASDSLRHLPQVQIHPRSGLAGDLPTIDLAVGYSKTNNSPVLKLFLSRLDELIERVSDRGAVITRKKDESS